MKMNEAKNNYELAAQKLEENLTACVAKDFTSMDEEEFRGMQSLINFMNAANKLIVAQAEHIEQINNKLDKLLERES